MAASSAFESFLPLSLKSSNLEIVVAVDNLPILFSISSITLLTFVLPLLSIEYILMAASNVDIDSALPALINWEPPNFFKDIFCLPYIKSVLGVLFTPFQSLLVSNVDEPNCFNKPFILSSFTNALPSFIDGTS